MMSVLSKKNIPIFFLFFLLLDGFGLIMVSGEEGYTGGWMGMPDWVMYRMDTSLLPDITYPRIPTNLEDIKPDVSSLISQGDRFLASGSYADAKNVFEEAINLDSDSFDAWLGRGQALEALNRTLSAEDSYTKAISLSDNAANVWAAYAGKGRTLSAQNRYQDAVKAFNRALSLFGDGIGSTDDLTKIYTGLAFAQQKLGNQV